MDGGESVKIEMTPSTGWLGYFHVILTAKRALVIDRWFSSYYLYATSFSTLLYASGKG